ncbi:DNA recombination/repair protein RecA [Patescibacteria group bacterium]|uniref:Putative RecA n=1 Tax=viral metagenome TaxID=1070528 RepID=A0A6M3MEY9_9ZZZZ|nr:DNA recombination/repair protein RecA [Patescibacteria group bacterium]MBU0847506.1 DNA recombination/repair protein RecA [Patescibacteria group bacterium]
MKITREGNIAKAIDQVKAASMPAEESPVEFIHSGSILLNLAASGKGRNGGWARGRIVNFVGDGSSGKTLLALEMTAYMFHKMPGNKSHNFPPVGKVRIIFDNSEGVMDFDLDQMYGSKKDPTDFRKGVIWECSRTVEEFGRKFAREAMNHKEGTCLLYVIDSLDALSSEAGQERFEEAAKKDKAEDGTYGTEKAKYLSASFFSNICSLIKGKDITLVVISQIRMKIGISFGEKYGRTGGKALDFYTHAVPWLSEIEKLKKTFRGEDRVYGIRVLVKLKRNKVAKPFREAEIIILFDYGVDDVGSSIAYLYGPKVKTIDWDGVEYGRAELINYIEQNNLQDELAKKVEKWWNEIEDNLKPNRISKYGD